MSRQFSIKDAARLLSGEVSGSSGVVCPGPNHGRKDRSLSVRFNPGGDFVVYSHAGDDFAACRDYVTAKLGLADDWRERDRRLVDASDADADDRAKLFLTGSIIRGLIPVKGTPGESYLRDERRIDVKAVADVLSHTGAIGWHPRCQYEGRRVGAIVAIQTDPFTGARTGGISRTLIEGGRKVRGAMSLGPMGVVRLTEDAEVLSGLHIAEGLETCLAAMTLGFRPMWSTGSRVIMASLPVLPGVECLTILADNDANGAGEKAARECRRRWREAGRECRAIMPEARGDVNDMTRRSA